MSFSSMSFKRVLGAALAVTAALSTAACATPVVSSTPTPVAFKACMVSSREGFNDSGANAAAYYGLLQSEAQFGPRTSVVQVAPDAGIDDFSAALNKLVKRDCNLVFGVGQQLVAPVRMAATAHPEVKFALVDAVLTNGNGTQLDLPNVKNIEFDATQAAFMAGYLAASQTGSSTIGLIAGARSHANLNQVYAFRQGVQYFDSKHAKSTVLIGAIGDAPETWSFLGSNPTKQAIHYKISGMTNAGADVVYQVGLPGLYVTKLVAVHPDVLVIGADSDWWTQPGFTDFKKVVLASGTKKIADAVVRTVGDAVSGIYLGGTGGSWLGTLGTGDVQLTEQHDVPYSIGIQSELDSIKADLISGKLSIDALSDL